MATTNRILIKSKSTAAGAPATSDVQIGELAVNTYTGLAYMGTKLSSSGSAGGAVGEVSTIAMPVSTSTSLGTSNLTTSTTGAIKTYVDAQVATEDTIAEMNDVTITSLANDNILQYNKQAYINSVSRLNLKSKVPRDKTCQFK